MYYISQSYFGLPRQSIRNNRDRKILFKQSLWGVESLYRDIGAYDIEYRKTKEMCRKAWSENFYYLYIDMTKIKKAGKCSIFNENKDTYNEGICETEAFWFFKCCFQLKLEVI